MNLIMSKIASTTARLNSYPPSSRSTPLRKVSMTDCLEGNLRQSDRMALTTMTLKSSEISDMKAEICFINRSTEASFPVYIGFISTDRRIAVEEADLEEGGDGESSD